MKNNSFRLNVLTRFVFLIIFSTFVLFSFSQTEKLYHSLDYINEQFKKHNTYNLQFQLDIEGKNLFSSSIYFEVTYPINQISSIYFTKRGDKDCRVFFKCQNDEQCINSLNINDSTTDLKSEYSFNLETNPEIAEKVVMEFMAIKNGINNINNNENTNPLTIRSELNSDIEYINRMMHNYNPYHVQYIIDWDKKVLLSRSTDFEVTYYPITLNPVELISRGDKDYIIKFTCKNDVTCLIYISIDDKKTDLKDNYTVNFSGNEQEAKKMINTFNHLLQNLK